MGTIEPEEEHIIKMTPGDFDTEKIKGKLNGVILDSDVQVSVTIESSLGYLIFHNSRHSGTEYYAPRALLQGAIKDVVVQDQFDKFSLNEGLNIRVMGPTDTQVTIILRIE